MPRLRTVSHVAALAMSGLLLFVSQSFAETVKIGVLGTTICRCISRFKKGFSRKKGLAWRSSPSSRERRWWLLSAPHATFALRNGSGVEIARGDKVDTNENLGVIIYADSFMKSRAKVADAFMRAFLRGCRLVNDAYRGGQLDTGPLGEKVVRAYLSFFEVKDPSLIKAMNPSGCDPDGRPDLAKLEQAYALFKERGLIQGKTEVKDLLDFEFEPSKLSVHTSSDNCAGVRCTNTEFGRLTIRLYSANSWT